MQVELAADLRLQRSDPLLGRIGPKELFPRIRERHRQGHLGPFKFGRQLGKLPVALQQLLPLSLNSLGQISYSLLQISKLAAAAFRLGATDRFA